MAKRCNDAMWDFHMSVLAIMTYSHKLKTADIAKLLECETNEVNKSKVYLKKNGYLMNILVPSKLGEKTLYKYEADYEVEYD